MKQSMLKDSFLKKEAKNHGFTKFAEICSLKEWTNFIKFRATMVFLNACLKKWLLKRLTKFLKKRQTEKNMRFLVCQFTQLELFPDYTDEVNEEIISIYIRWVEFFFSDFPMS